MEQSRINIVDMPWVECECGGITFSQLIMMKKVSKLLTGEPKDNVMEIPVMKCDSCGKIPGFMHKPFPNFPEELKAKSPLNLNTSTTSTIIQ